MSPQTTEIPSSAWKRRTVLFLISQCVTLFGSTVVQMAIVWYITLETSSGAWVAAFTVCSYLPQFLLSFIGGALADRHNRKTLIIASDAVIATATLALFFLLPNISSGTMTRVMLLIVSAVRSCGTGIQTPAVNAVIPSLVPTDNLMRWSGINATMQSVVQFAAPAAAGALLSVSTLRSALAVDIITAVLGIGLLAAILLPKQRDAQAGTSVFADMRAGIKYAFCDRFLGRLLAVYGLFIFLSVPAGFLAQLLVSRLYGDSYIYLTAVELVGFAGMTAGGIIMGVWGGFRSRVRTLVVALAAFGALAVGMGAVRNFIIYLALMLVYGVALTMVQTATTVLIGERAEPDMQGRVFGLLGAMYSGFLPLGMTAFGPLADILPLPAVIIASGVAIVFLPLLMLNGKAKTAN